jgi:hypothetical protein
MLAKLFVTLIVESDLLFLELDPDSFVCWCLDLIRNHRMDSVQTSHSLYSMYRLLNGPFRHWVSIRYELLSLYCAALLSGVVIDSDFADPELVIVERTESFVSQFIGGENHDSTKEWLVRVIRELQRGWDNETQFALLGLARIRFQSPDFSVIQDFKDRLLFMKALLRLCAFCDFWDPDEAALANLDRDDIETKLKVEIARKVVWPWIRLFQTFNPLEELFAGLTKMLRLLGEDAPALGMNTGRRPSAEFSGIASGRRV